MIEDLVAGDGIGPYRIEAEIGRGGMGVVYRCWDARLQRQVAVKVMGPSVTTDPGVRARFLREATAVAAVDHPNVVPIYDAGESDGRLYLVMRFIDGSTAQDEIDRNGAMRPQRVATIIDQAGAALDAAHDRGIIHRDVKPANIMLTELREGEHVYLTDFGLAALTDAGSRLTKLGNAVGSIDYLAPEQIQTGVATARTDTYSLACVAYKLLTGSVPFPKDSDIAKLWGHVNEDPPRASAFDALLDPVVDGVLARAMSKKPEDRQATSGDFADELAGALKAPATRSTSPGSAPPPDAARFTRRRLRLATVVGIVALVAIGVVLAYTLGPGRKDQASPAGAVPAIASASSTASSSSAPADFSPAYAAAMLNIYLRALGNADVTQICALNMDRAPGNPNGLSSSQCADRYERAIKDHTGYWQPGQAPRWAGMTAQADRATRTANGGLSFDSRAGAFAYGAGEPADCAAAAGCQFVVSYVQGDAFLERAPTPGSAAGAL